MLVKLETTKFLIYAELDATERVIHYAYTNDKLPVFPEVKKRIGFFVSKCILIRLWVHLLEPWVLYVVTSSLNLKFFIVKQQKPKALIFPESCCSRYVVLTILNINFKCFKGAFRPCYIYVFGFKGGRLWDKRWTFMG